MEHPFILSCESTVDLPYAYVTGRDIPVLFYTYQAEETTYTDDMGRDPKALPHFYDLLAGGALPTTSQINQYQYEEFFDGLLKKGDVLHINFGSGMTGSVNNARLAAETLREKYPGRRLEIIDSLCSSSGYGMLVDYAADLRDKGCSLEETTRWVRDHCKRVHHQFFSTQLDFYRRSGRMSGAMATLATILNICPIMRLDDGGRIIAYDKVRGKKNAIRRTLDTMEAHAEGGADYAGKCFVCHSNCLAESQATKAALEERFPHIDGDIRMIQTSAGFSLNCRQ